MRFIGISNRLSSLRGSINHSLATSATLMVLLSVGLLTATSVMAQPVANIQNGFAGTSAGDWSTPGNVTGPADNNCANMGALDKVNLVSNFGFAIPGGATITDATAFIKASSPGGQTIGVQLASDATVDPPTDIGNPLVLPVFASNSGNCAVTSVTQIGTNLASWGLGSLAPAVVNSPSFGMIFTKLETSSVKVDSICLQIGYETNEGPAVVEECFALITNSITVVKDVVGAAPGSDWGFTGDLGVFTLPAAGGFQVFPGLDDDSYTITETTKLGYTAAVACTIDAAPGPSGSDEVTVAVAEGESAVCVFTNTLNTGAFTVNKNFSDDSPASVDMTLTCSSGAATTNPVAATEASPAVFEVTGFTPAATCTATEAATPGYTQDNSGCQVGGLLADGGSCTMVNTLNTNTFTVNKTYDDATLTAVTVTASCTGGGSFAANPLPAAPGAPAVFIYNGFIGNPTCTALESGVPAGYTANNADCQDNDALGGSCTIANTLNPIAPPPVRELGVVPTLNQYGLALMALLMLGIGAVGFRRFR